MCIAKYIEDVICEKKNYLESLEIEYDKSEIERITKEIEILYEALYILY